MIRKYAVFCALVLLALFIPHLGFAQTVTLDLGGQAGAVAPGAEGAQSVTGRVFQLIALMTVLSLAPSLLIMATSFTRIIIVLSFVRTAIGLQQTPPNNIIIGLALFMTFFIMQPTFQAAYDAGIQPLINQQITETEAFERAVVPFKNFMIANTRDKDMSMFYELGKVDRPETAEETPLRVLMPAFMISELQRAFEIGFMLFLPFLVIDMVTAAILMSMGMMMLPPVTISLPFKIIFFVIVDGWALIVGALLQSYGIGAGVPLPGAGGG